MKCPKCSGKMLVTHSWIVSEGPNKEERTQTVECEECNTTATVVVESLMKKVDPLYGEGSFVLAKRMREDAEKETTP